ncbi:agenet and bromo-adjacent homology (BAH) domain-containing protein [Actinidia rufa]|uniref:Agenet and bromo-adjacent homology (BAH) domain-containing protein n=1 Tax=Actinidia rufa TaxID=165716 RepID=A0A7J0HEA5_9ERIC|nr:agenet and bromo-adjacent homology (BAH) domain-containing protein [Actinidia rufa]
MEKSAAETSSEFVRWEEVHVSSGIRRREVYYHLFRRDGTSDLAVDYEPVESFRNSFALNLDSPPHQSSQYVGGSPDNNNACKLDVETFKVLHGLAGKSGGIIHHFSGIELKFLFMTSYMFWLKKKKRLVAYLEDMYQDSRGNKMVVDPVERQPFEDGLKFDINLGDGVRSRPKIRLRRSKDGDLCLRSAKKESLSHCLDVRDSHGNLVGSEGGIDDSGLRGCWFRALIIKKHKDKIKVQYQDIRDAADEARHLEEWVLASKIAVPDPLGLRMYGRTTIRPTPPSNKGKVPLFLSAGTVVDVWWHDGWWEGIVLQKESEDKICVYFPGEKQELLFGSCDLRHSQEWWGNGWGVIKERPDLASSILSDLERKQVVVKASFVEREKAATCERRELASVAHNDSLPVKDEIGSSKYQMNYVMGKAKESEMVCDLLKDPLLEQLKWKTSGKRKRGKSVQKLHYVGDRNSKQSRNCWPVIGKPTLAVLMNFCEVKSVGMEAFIRMRFNWFN